MLTRKQKEEQVTELRDKFERATSVFVADYRGLGVLQIEALRSGLRADEANESEFRVVKNSVLRLASDGGVAQGLKDHFTGTTSVAITFGDPVALAKTLVGYAKTNEAFELRGALLDGQVLDTTEISTLATLPSLDELRGKIVGLLQAPASQLARLLTEPAGQMARLVGAREASLGEGGE
jgi:large subunit ribosomal protein L10